MKLATYSKDGRESYGVVTDSGILDAAQLVAGAPPTLLAALRQGADCLSRLADASAASSARAIPLDDLTLLAPLPNPPKAIGLAVNYVEHHNEFSRGQNLPEDPKLHTTPRPFLMPTTALAGPNSVIPWPIFSRQIDYEIELTIVIGAEAKCVSPEQAGDFIAGYTIANDISARSVTHVEARSDRPKDAFFDWLHGKWADGFLPTGPWIVTADEVPDPSRPDLELTVNGQTRQKANTRRMIFSVFELVSFLSHIMTLTPGDLIATGTPSGVGMASGNLLEGGDVIVCRIEGLGQLTSTMGPAPESFYTPCR